jgi:ribosomal protein L35AE/L33A
MMKKTFKAKLQKSPNKGGWIYVVWPDSVKFFGTGGAVKVKAETREAIGKDVGDVVTVILEERIESAKARSKRSVASRRFIV